MSESDINLHVVAVFAWIKRGDKYLLSRRASDDPQAGGLWALPGGKLDLEMGDGIVETGLAREIKEETDLTIADKITFLTSQGFTRASGHHVVSLVFLTKYKSGEAKPLEDQEEVQWLTLGEVEKLINNDKRLSYLKAGLKELKRLR